MYDERISPVYRIIAEYMLNKLHIQSIVSQGYVVHLHEPESADDPISFALAAFAKYAAIDIP